MQSHSPNSTTRFCLSYLITEKIFSNTGKLLNLHRPMNEGRPYCSRNISKETLIIIVLCQRGTERPMQELCRILERLRLTLNEAKTKIVNAYKGKYNFLGFSICMGRSNKTGKLYPHVQPSKKSLQAIKDRVTNLTKRERTIMPMEWVVNEVNATLRGWVGYFHYRNCSTTMAHIRNHVEQRMITHLRKRHKGRDRKMGYVRFKQKALYEKYGLYKVPTTAGWTQAHALR